VLSLFAALLLAGLSGFLVWRYMKYKREGKTDGPSTQNFATSNKPPVRQ